MNKMKSLEYSRKIFRLEILLQGLLLMIFLLSPVKLVSFIGSALYISMYTVIYKLIIKKSGMKMLLLLNVLLNILPAVVFYFILYINYDTSFTNFSFLLFTILALSSIIGAYKFVNSKANIGLFKGVYIIPFILSQYMINNVEVYTSIMVIYIIFSFLLFRYPFVCYRMYKNKEEYIYY